MFDVLQQDIEIIDVSSREDWLALRKNDVTASTIAALFGEHEYQTALGLYMLKSGQVTEDPEESPAMQRGRLLEPVAIQLLQEKRPSWKLMPNHGQRYFRHKTWRIGATPDCLWECPERGLGVVQIKSVEPFIFKRKWAENGHIEPPLWIGLQAYSEAVLTGAKWAAVAPMRVGHGVDIDLVEIPLNVDLLQAIREKVAGFWKLIEAQTPPPADYTKDGELLVRRYASVGTDAKDLSAHNRIGELCEDRLKWAARKKSCESALDYIDNEIIDILGEAPEAIHPDYKITRKQQKRKETVLPASTFRVLRVSSKTTPKQTEEE